MLAGCAEPTSTPAAGAAAALPERGPEPEWGPDDPRSLFDFVTSLAAERARTRWVPPVPPIRGRAAASLTYDEYREIRFRRSAAPWSPALPFELQLDHPGAEQSTPVHVSVVSSAGARALRFDADQFDYDGSVDARSLGLGGDAESDVGYGGLRILARMNDPDHLDEVVSFRGASYFRLIGPGHVYGTSLRGIAVNTAGPTPEEFPDFVRFWVGEPAPGDSVLVLHALLDGPSVAGAYRFELIAGRGPGVAPGDGEPRPTEMTVRARLFARASIPRLGVAPLTSMFLHGDVDPPAPDRVRPRVHDAETLVMETHAGEVITRPLSSPAAVRVTSLRDRDPRGYGLAQPRRRFEDFLDLEAEYHRRPGLWIEPMAPWGEGGVMLAELPTTSEFADNVVAFWAPDGALEVGERIDFAWRIRTFDAEPPTTARPLGRVVRSRIGGAGLPGQAAPPPAHHRRIVVDFEGEGLRAIGQDVVVDPVIFASTGEVRDLRVERLPTGGRRATWILEGEPGVPADMRIFLRAPGGRTETWSYLLDLPTVAEPEAR